MPEIIIVFGIIFIVFAPILFTIHFLTESEFMPKTKKQFNVLIIDIGNKFDDKVSKLLGR